MAAQDRFCCIQNKICTSNKHACIFIGGKNETNIYLEQPFYLLLKTWKYGLGAKLRYMVVVCLVQRLLEELKQSNPLKCDIGKVSGLITSNCWCQNDPLDWKYRYLSLNLENWQIPNIVVIWLKWYFHPKFYFHVLAKMILLVL